MTETTAGTWPATDGALLADGTTVRIRPLRPTDHAAVRHLHATLTDADLRLRFFTVDRRAPQRTADRLCGAGGPGMCALGAFAGDELVGVAESQRDADDPGTADIALAVAEGHHRLGIGTLLLEHLVHAARSQGVHLFTADSLADNHAVQQVFTDLGLHLRRTLDHGEIRIEVDLDEDDEHYREVVDARDRAADVASLVPLLRPRSVAVIGAGRGPGSVGRSVLEKIGAGGFTGALYAVNPHADRIAGVPCHPDVAALPTAPDLAVVAVPAAAVPETAEQCGRAGVRALVVLTAGLDRDQGRALLDACRRHSIRLVGPNCLGIASTGGDSPLDATFSARRPVAGTAGVAVQSGGVGIALLERLGRLGIGVSDFVSLGDKYDVSGNDLLRWWERDGRTELAVLHLESFGNPRVFARTARRVARRMPVLTVDAGRSEAGRRGAASHTSAAATPTVARQALFGQAGITATRSIGDLVGAALLLSTQPLPGPAGTVAVVSNAGGVGVLAADACTEAGLTVPPLPATLAEQLGAVLPAGASTANPVDTTAAVGPDALRACLDLLATGGAVDAVLVCLAPTALGVTPGRDPLEALRHGPARRPRPVAAALLDQEAAERRLTTGDGGSIPAYADPQSAVRALAHAVERARALARPTRPAPEPAGLDPERARTEVRRFLAEHPDGAWADPHTCAAVLACYGLPLAPWEWAATEDEAARAAARLAALGEEGRVVLKAYWPGQVHKSDVGAVQTGLTADGRVRGAWRGFQARFGDRMTGAVLQPQAELGVELLAGLVQDPVFGPLVVLGAGGTAADVLDDRATRLAPLDAVDLHDMVTSLRCTPLLLGHRGADPVDLAGLEDLLARLSRLAADLPEVAEADLNPVVARPDGLTALDVRMRIAPGRLRDPWLRRLRALPVRAVD